MRAYMIKKACKLMNAYYVRHNMDWITLYEWLHGDDEHAKKMS